MVKTQEKISKKSIQDYWGDNPPGLDINPFPADSKEFFEEADAQRYRQEKYLLSMIKEVAAKSTIVLEVGCGLGADSRQFAKEGVSIFSMDLSFDNVKRTKKGFELLGLKGHFVHADAEHLPFKDDTFDLVYSNGVLHHTPNTKKAVKDIYRVLAGEGRIWVMLYHKGLAYLSIWIIGFLTFDLFRMSKDELFSKWYDHTPLSKMYNERNIKELFDQFRLLSFKFVNFGGAYSRKLLSLIYSFIDRVPFLSRRLSSFIIIRGYK